MRTVYLDYASGSPIHPDVVPKMLPYLKEHYGNPRSLSTEGYGIKDAIDEARGEVAGLVGAKPGEIYFTSSGTESNNLAIKGISRAYRKKGNHIIVSSVEHLSVLYSVKSLKDEGYTITHVPVDRYGVVDPDDVFDSITDETILVSIMSANNEVGTIQPIDEIAAGVRERGVIFHTDGVAAVGKIPVDVKASGIDGLSLSGNQFGGPPGSAALFLKKGIRIKPIMDGGIQEDGRRPGTENVPGIVGMGEAARLVKGEMKERNEKLSSLRDRLIDGLTRKIDHIYLTGHPTNRLSNHASICVEFIEGEAMLLSLSMEGISVASGSACTSRALKASHVLTAMSIPDALAQGSIVFTLGTLNNRGDIDYLIEAFPPIVERLRKMSPLYTKYLKEQRQISSREG